MSDEAESGNSEESALLAALRRCAAPIVVFAAVAAVLACAFGHTKELLYLCLMAAFCGLGTTTLSFVELHGARRKPSLDRDAGIAVASLLLGWTFIIAAYLNAYYFVVVLKRHSGSLQAIEQVREVGVAHAPELLLTGLALALPLPVLVVARVRRVRFAFQLPLVVAFTVVVGNPVASLADGGPSISYFVPRVSAALSAVASAVVLSFALGERLDRSLVSRRRNGRES